MLPFTLSPAFVAMVLAVFGILVAAALIRRSRNARFKARNGIPESSRRLHLKLSMSEFEGIAQQLGMPFARTLLRNLAAQIRSIVPLAEPLIMRDNALQIVLPVDDAATPDQAIIDLLCGLPESVQVDGLQFAIHLNAVLLRDTAAPAALEQDAKGSMAAMADGYEAQYRANLALLAEFSEALAANTISLAYQPKLDLRTSEIASVEALLRWTRKDGTAVNIADLIALFEATGTTRPVTFWALRRAIADTCRMREAGHILRTYVNISGTLLSHADFADEVLNAVSGNESLIGIEITETAAIAHPETALRNLQAIARAGVSIAIDDFGAGVSSLEYLQRLPANELKIDRNFIASLSSSHRNPLIVKATIDLAHALEMRVTAEGVDDQLSLALLRVMGCDMAQGYLVSRPLALTDLLTFLQSHLLTQETAAPLAKAIARG
jgi:EAL domain-containing protein (putative c-di-GMP-specific phosphodiesterase class I)